MRVLFDHSSPFALAHGGFQTQIEQTRLALIQAGHEVEHLRWWDDTQRGDLIHFFGPASIAYLQQARSKGWPVVMTTLFTETCNRSDGQLRLLPVTLPPGFPLPAPGTVVTGEVQGQPGGDYSGFTLELLTGGYTPLDLIQAKHHVL